MLWFVRLKTPEHLCFLWQKVGRRPRMLHFVRLEMVEFSTSLSSGYVAIINTYIYKRHMRGEQWDFSESLIIICLPKVHPNSTWAEFLLYTTGSVFIYVLVSLQSSQIVSMFSQLSCHCWVRTEAPQLIYWFIHLLVVCLFADSLDHLSFQTLRKTKQTNTGQCERTVRS